MLPAAAFMVVCTLALSLLISPDLRVGMRAQTAADIIKVAMNRVRAALREEGLVSALILQVHDELILQVRKGEEEAAARILKREMEGAIELKVPLEVEVKTGGSWYELK